ncbi:MAG: ester cyclase [Dongiaceae bacterium]
MTEWIGISTFDPIDALVSGLNARSFDTVFAALSPNWIDHRPDRPGDRLRFRQDVEAVLAAIPDLVIAIDDRVDAGDRVFLRLTLSGTHSGELFGVAATGAKVRFRSHDLHRIAKGKIVESWQLEDWLAVLSQIGVQPSLLHRLQGCAP